MRISIGSDHAGFELKSKIKEFLAIGHEVIDRGVFNLESVDYPDFAEAVAREVVSGNAERGILVCGTGIGMSIAANKVPGVRAALCHDIETARLSREHNDANILALGGRTTDPQLAIKMVQEWLVTEFNGSRHARRLEKIRKIEEKQRL